MPVVAKLAGEVLATASGAAASLTPKGGKTVASPPPPDLGQTQEQQDMVRAKLGNRKQRSLLAQLQGGTVATGSLGLPAEPAPLAKKSLLGQ
jgi:hypothetical protein